MQSLLEQLENNEAVLLMFLANELPPEDRAEVELQLQNDAQLREQLAQLQQMNQTLSIALGASSSTADESAQAMYDHRQARLVQNVTAALMSAQARTHQLAQAAADNAPAHRSLRIPQWAYPIATAAMLLIAFIAYWGLSNGPDKTASSNPSSTITPEVTQPDSGLDNRYIDRLANLSIDDGDRDLLAISASGNDVSTGFQIDSQ